MIRSGIIGVILRLCSPLIEMHARHAVLTNGYSLITHEVKRTYSLWIPGRGVTAIQLKVKYEICGEKKTTFHIFSLILHSFTISGPGIYLR